MRSPLRDARGFRGLSVATMGGGLVEAGSRREGREKRPTPAVGRRRVRALKVARDSSIRSGGTRRRLEGVHDMHADARVHVHVHVHVLLHVQGLRDNWGAI